MQYVLKQQKIVAVHDDWQTITTAMYPGSTIFRSGLDLKPGDMLTPALQGADYEFHDQDQNLDPDYLTTMFPR
jgi:hypothetical protein